MGVTEIFSVFMFIFGWGSYGPPIGVPPGPADAVITNAAPEEFLMYTTWRGVGEMKPDTSPTDRWIAQKEVQTAVQKFKKAILHFSKNGMTASTLMINRFLDGDLDEWSRLATPIVKAGLKNPGAIYLTEVDYRNWDDEPPVLKGTIILKLGDEAVEATAAIKKGGDQLAKTQESWTKIELDGGTFYQFSDESSELPFQFGVHDGYLVVGLGVGELEKLIDQMKTPAPAWVASVEKKLKVERICSVTRLNLKRIIEKIPNEIMDSGDTRALFGVSGLMNVEGIDWLAGIDSNGFVTRTEIRTAKKEGFLKIIGGEPIPKRHLKEIPDDVMAGIGVRLSTSTLLDLILEASDGVGEKENFEAMLAEADEWLGIDLRKSMEESLDDYAFFYGNLNIASPMSGVLAGIRVRDAMSFEDTYFRVIDKIKTNLEDSDSLVLKTQKAGAYTIYSVKEPNGFAFSPEVSWCLGPDHLYIGLAPGAIAKHLRTRKSKENFSVSPAVTELYEFGESIGSGGPIMVASLDVGIILQNVLPMIGGFGMEGDFSTEFPFGFGDLPGIEVWTNGLKPDIAGVFDTESGFQVYQRQIIPGASPGMTMGLFAGISMPAAAQARMEIKNRKSSNNMRQVLLALLNYEASHMHFPAAYSQDKDEKPLLSWRVHILPFIEEGELYDQFHLDEPWDSEHNKTLVEKMPKIYAHPKIELAEGKTTFLGMGGADGIFSAPIGKGKSNEGIGFGAIRDGSSNTLMVVEIKSDHAVTWTKPGDFDPAKFKKLSDAFEGNWPNGVFNLGRCDGSVLSGTSKEYPFEEIKKMTTKDGGEVIKLK